MRSRNIKYLLAAIIVLLLTSLSVSAQNSRRARRAAARSSIAQTAAAQDPLALDSLQIADLDSLNFVRDSIARADSLFRS
ncbi:MAG: hypothetical protein Q4G10_06515, partial [Bacteroidia bacterium]|nr:hypothetical protein [Bacteroidia bacterium]